MAMLSSWRWRAKALLFLLIAAGVGAVWFGLAHDRAASPLVVAASSAAPAGGPAVPVTEGRAETRDVPIWLSGIGSVQPLNTVTVKVRVDGQLDRVAFTEGQDVHKGRHSPVRSGCSNSRAEEFRSGEVFAEFGPRSHWVENHGATPVTFIAANIHRRGIARCTDSLCLSNVLEIEVASRD